MITSAALLVEVTHPRINDAALKWTLSRLRVEPALTQSAATLLRAARLHGHEYAIDANALRHRHRHRHRTAQPGPSHAPDV